MSSRSPAHKKPKHPFPERRLLAAEPAASQLPIIRDYVNFCWRASQIGPLFQKGSFVQPQVLSVIVRPVIPCAPCRYRGI